MLLVLFYSHIRMRAKILIKRVIYLFRGKSPLAFAYGM